MGNLLKGKAVLAQMKGFMYATDFSKSYHAVWLCYCLRGCQIFMTFPVFDIRSGSPKSKRNLQKCAFILYLNHNPSTSCAKLGNLLCGHDISSKSAQFCFVCHYNKIKES